MSVDYGLRCPCGSQCVPDNLSEYAVDILLGDLWAYKKLFDLYETVLPFVHDMRLELSWYALADPRPVLEFISIHLPHFELLVKVDEYGRLNGSSSFLGPENLSAS